MPRHVAYLLDILEAAKLAALHGNASALDTPMHRGATCRVV